MGQRESDLDVRIMLPPASFVIFVHGMWNLADLAPVLRSVQEISVLLVTCSFGSNFSVIIVSPRCLQPKKVHVMMAQRAASWGFDRMMDLRTAVR